MKKTAAALILATLALPAMGKTITIKGSDTMVIMNAKFAEEFMKKQPATTIQVTGGGSGVGLAALINGTTEIAASSRPIRPSEINSLKTRFATQGVAVPVARDGLAVYLHASNPVQELTLAQIREIYTGKITNWQQVGGRNAPIVLYSRENSSGTYGYFKEFVLLNKDYSPRAQTLQGTAAVVNAVAKDVNGIGYGGAAYAKGVKFAKVKKDAASPGILPALETVRSGQYPISRYLYYYLRTAPKGESKQFIDWILSAEGQSTVTRVGYFPVK
jgi:phosphate transport system substrate-binding protein